MRIRTLNEAAAALGISRHRLRRGIAAGRYPTLPWGNRALVDLDAIEPIVAAENAEAEKTVGVGQLSALTGLPPTTIRKMCKAGMLPYTKDKQRRYLFRVSDVMAAIQNMME